MPATQIDRLRLLLSLEDEERQIFLAELSQTEQNELRLNWKLWELEIMGPGRASGTDWRMADLADLRRPRFRQAPAQGPNGKGIMPNQTKICGSPWLGAPISEVRAAMEKRKCDILTNSPS